jgi:BirA family biotin operon repressor/biotin-[acetyl-CoA-carboxylase] ligase
MPPILHLKTVDSTNAEAMRRAVSGEQGPLWIVADEQTAGRGRAGRSWTSGAENLLASLLVTSATPPAKAYQLALVTGVAAFDALAVVLGSEHAKLRLKWPNDIFLDGAKAGGILIESTTQKAGPGAPALTAVIGIGINIASKPELPDRPTASLAEFGAALTPEALLERLASAMDAWLGIWAEGSGFAAVREAWLDRAHPLGERMMIDTGEERVSGYFAGLDMEGALVLDTEAGVRHFTFGDVSLEKAGPNQ